VKGENRAAEQQRSRAADQQKIPLIPPLQRGIIKNNYAQKNPSFLKRGRGDFFA